MKKRTLWITFLLVLLNLSVVFAEKGYQDGKIFLVDDVHHAWTVRFSHSLKVETIHEQNIRIQDARGRILPTKSEVFEENKVRVIPQIPYAAGEAYRLVLNENIQSTGGKKLYPPVYMNFRTNLQKTIEGAQQIYQQAQEGSFSGTYAPGSKKRFAQAIEEARSVQATQPSYEKELQAVLTLSKAIEDFRKQKILNPLQKMQAPVFGKDGIVRFKDSVNASKATAYQIQIYQADLPIRRFVIDKEERAFSVREFLKQKGPGSYTVSIIALGDGEVFGDAPESERSESQQVAPLSKPSLSPWSKNTVSWSPVPDAAQYEIRFYKNFVSIHPTIQTTRPHYDFSELFHRYAAGEYQVRLRALAKPDTLDLDSEFTDYSQTKTVQGPLSSPTGVQLDEKGLVRWEPVSHADGYEIRIYRGNTPIGTNAIVGKEIRSHSFLSMIRSYGLGQYTATVKALGSGIFSASKESALSPVVTARSLSVPTIQPWSAHTAQWSAVSGANQYEVQLFKNGENTGYWFNTSVNRYDFTSVIENTLKAGTYTVIVRALPGESIHKNSDYSLSSTKGIRHAKYTQTTIRDQSKKITLHFDDTIYNATDSLAGLREHIRIARSGSEFAALGDSDTVTVGSNELTIHLNAALTGSENQIKILKNALKDNSLQTIPEEILVRGLTADDGIELNVAITTSSAVTNANGQSVNVTSTKLGRVYLIKNTETVPNQAAMDIAVREKKGAYTEITQIGTETAVNVSELTPGTYQAYAIDRQGQIAKGSESIEIKDGIPPVLAVAAQQVTNAAGQKITAQINEPGTIYLIESGAYTVTAEPLKTTPNDGEITAALLASPKKAVKIPVDAATVNQEVKLSTEGLLPGTYHVFAKDTAGNWSEKANALIKVRDGVPPQVTVSAQTVSNGESDQATAQSDKEGWLYLVLKTESITRPEDLEVARQADPNTLLQKGARIQVTADGKGTALTLSTYRLIPGDYVAYAVDPVGNLSAASGNKITVDDTTKPAVIAETQAAGTAAGQKVFVMSTEAGTVYIIKEGESQDTLEQWNTAVDAKKGAKAAVQKVNAMVSIPTEGLRPGTYYAYAVDAKGNLSVKDDSPITITP